MRTELHAIVADTLFDSEELRTDFAALIEDGRIHSLVPKAELPRSVPALCLPCGTWLAPGFVDVQVNGGGDVLFNDDPTPTTMARIAAAHLPFGTTALLPTLISDSREKMIAAIDAAGFSGSTWRAPSFRRSNLECMTAAGFERPTTGICKFLRAPVRAS